MFKKIFAKIKKIFAKIKKKTAKELIRDLIVLIIVFLGSVKVISDITNIFTKTVYITFIIIFVFILISLESSEDLVTKYKRMNSMERKIFFFEQLSIINKSFFNDMLAIIGIILSLVSILGKYSNNLFFGFVLLTYCMWGYNKYKNEKAKWTLNLIKDDKSIAKSYQSKFKKFNRRR